MATQRKPQKQEAKHGYDALSIEGGLLPPEWLARVAQLQAAQQSEPDYGVPKGLNLRDEIGRYWRIAQAYWKDFDAGLASGGDARALAERFVLALLQSSFGFSTLAPIAPVQIGERSFPIGFSAHGVRIPVVIAPAGTGLEEPLPQLGDGGRRRTSFGLAQEYLNAVDEALWGIACDGKTLRILRDNASLTRPAWIEADLARIFTEGRYPDFVALWLLAHESRFGKPGQAVNECPLEVWREAGREEGTRARADLRNGVEQALLALGQGFLAHPENAALLADLQSGALSTKDYFNQLLRLVYRLIFLLTVEERGLLHPDGTDDKAKALYAQGYGMRRVRERSIKRSAHDRHSDLWEVAKIVFRGLSQGETRLGLPALAGIFAADQCAALDKAKLENHAFLLAVFNLAWLHERGLERVNWRDMGPEELGSVYESLLELVPQISGGRTFGFAQGGETKGNARKTSGSYYTPDSLVQVLLDSALDPVIADTSAKNSSNPVEALLGLSIVDPACGSGHFLLAAARRLAAQVARLEAGGTPSASQYRHALRQVVGRCVYGVDLNPMAVELCRVSLWMEAVEPGRPLSFLDSHIQQGNALLGTTPELMAKGIPDAAWEPIEGDDKKTASALKKRNKSERESKNTSFEFSTVGEGGTIALASQMRSLDAVPDADLAGLIRKGQTWAELLDSRLYQSRRLAADAWCAALVWPKQPGQAAAIAPTHGEWERIRHDPQQASLALVGQVHKLAGEYQFFHWHLQFPQVFAKGGFDVVLGNPPWDQIELDPIVVLHDRPSITGAPNQAARDRAIARLPHDDPEAFARWTAAKRSMEGIQQFLHASGHLPLSSYGRLNTAPCFTELSELLIRDAGRVGIIVPTSVVSEAFNQKLFRSLVEKKSIRALFDFENTAGARLFPGVGHRRFKLCLLTLGRNMQTDAFDVVFFAHHVAELVEPARRYRLTASDIELANPNTWTCPAFHTARDAAICLSIHRRFSVLKRENGADNEWKFSGLLMFMMGGASERFLNAPRSDSLPLIEAKMIHQFDHRYGDYADRPNGSENTSLPSVPEAKLNDPWYAPRPRYWLDRGEVDKRLAGRWQRLWCVAWRDVCRSGDERTLISTIIPRHAVAHTLPVACLDHDARLVACFQGMLASFALDYVARQKLGGTHMTYSYLHQLPVLSPATFCKPAPWTGGEVLLDWLVPRILELVYTAWDLEHFAHDVLYEGPPFRWDPTRRFLLRCELDAAFFHLYGISSDDADYVMDTFASYTSKGELFSGVKGMDVKAHGEYRTKRVILEIYAAMAEASHTGKPYQTCLDPPPADARIAHEPRPGIAGPMTDDSPPTGDGGWSRPRNDEESEAAISIAAVLKAVGKPRPSREVRLAAMLVLEPELLLPSLDAAQAATWRRLIGDELRPSPSNVSRLVPPADRAWGGAVRHLRGNGLLAEDLTAKTWAPGPGLGSIQTEGWPDGRARFVLAVLRQRGEQAVVDSMPESLRGWLNAAAA